MPVCGSAGSAVEILFEFRFRFRFFFFFFFFFWVLLCCFARWLRVEEMDPVNAVTDRRYVGPVHSFTTPKVVLLVHLLLLLLFQFDFSKQ